MTDLTKTIPELQERIRRAEQAHGRVPGSVRLVAVSKTRPAADLARAYSLGLRRFGESYVQEALAKIEVLRDLDIEWHFIGPIQSNKTRDLARNFTWIHSVDRARIAQRLSEQRPTALGPLQVLLQVNTSGEASKSGCRPEEAAVLARAIAALPNLRLRGLMTIPAPAEDFEAQRAPFRILRNLLEDLQKQGIEADQLSMGMSDDLEAAIAEGATLIRIGSAVFGAR